MGHGVPCVLLSSISVIFVIRINGLTSLPGAGGSALIDGLTHLELGPEPYGLLPGNHVDVQAGPWDN
jgi:hypothetical protein